MEKRRLLILEDEPTTAKRLVKGFERRDFRVTLATNGAEGFYRFCASPRFCAIIVDLLMPDVSGYEFLRMLETLHRTGVKKVIPPVIVNSSCEKYDDLREIIEYEVVHAITTKPANVGYLSELVHAVSSESRKTPRKLRKHEELELLLS